MRLSQAEGKFYFFTSIFCDSSWSGGWPLGQSVFWIDRRCELESATGVCVLFFFSKRANIRVK